MNVSNHTTELRAEVLLRQLYPQMADKWIVETRGTFYRNYSSDLLQVDAQRATVTLSRDGMSKTLPAGIFAPEKEYKGSAVKGKNKEINQRNEVISEFFRPFDTHWFRKSLQVEEQIAQAVEQKLDFILHRYYGCNRQAESNPYVRQLMTLLPNVASLRGDLAKIKHLLAALFATQVDMRLTQVDAGMAQVEPQDLVEYRVCIESVNSEQYAQWLAVLQPVQAFIEEWFIPAYMQVQLVLRSPSPRTLNHGTLLNYNTIIATSGKDGSNSHRPKP